MSEDKDETSIFNISRQEIFTGLFWAIFALIPAAAVVTLWIVFSNPETAKQVIVSG